jgi:hypothetical protein
MRSKNSVDHEFFNKSGQTQQDIIVRLGQVWFVLFALLKLFNISIHLLYIQSF